MSMLGTSFPGIVLALMTVGVGVGCSAQTHAPTLACVPADGGSLTDAGHGGGGNVPRLNGCQPGVIGNPPGATGDGGSVGIILPGAGGATGDGGAFGTGGATVSAGGALVGFGGSMFGVGGSLEGASGSLNLGIGG